MSADLFTNRFNHRLPQFVSPFPDNLALAVDGLAFPWDRLDLYAFPPTPLILLVLDKLDQCDCLLTLIAPLQWRRLWISTLFRLCLRPPLRLLLWPDLLYQLMSELLHDSLD